MGTRLVRDGILEMDGFSPDLEMRFRPVRDDGEHDRLLRQKLLEECGELIGAIAEEDVYEEIVDIYEVLLAMLERAALTEEDLLLEARAKRVARGGFSGGLVWER